MPFWTGRLDDLLGAGIIASPLTCSFILCCSGGDGESAMVCALVGCGLDVFLCGGDMGIGGIASSSGDGIVCIFLELVPLRREN